MKKITNLLVVAMVVLGLSSCGNQSKIEKLLPGTWTTIKTLSEEETEDDFAQDLSMDVTVIYEADHETEAHGTMTLLMHAYDEDGYNPITLTFRFEIEGRWSLNGDKLTETYTDVDLELVNIEAEYADAVYEAVKQNLAFAKQQFKEELMKGGETRITKITENSMEQEDDEDVFYYQRVK